MTLIIGIEDPSSNRVILAADSGAWRGDQVDILRTPKIWRSDGWIAGLSGQWASSLCARRVPLPPMASSATREEIEIAVLDWSEKATEAICGERDRSHRSGAQLSECGPSLLVAHGPWLWYVHSGCVVSVTRGYHAIGAEDYAMGALSALSLVSPWEPVALAGTVMRAVARISRSIEGPFRWLGTDGFEGVFE